jgi:hypothetical protein
VADCTDIGERELDGEDGVEVIVNNRCTLPVSCTVEWTLVCAPRSKKRRARHRGKQQFTVASGSAGNARASAQRCGDDSWELSGITWACAVSQE